MRKNGFIATSILYSFFLVFVTLFVALVMNYLHNQILVSRVEEEARSMINKKENMRIQDMDIGAYVQFNYINDQNILNQNSNWIFVNKYEDGDNINYEFISDLRVSNFTSDIDLGEGKRAYNMTPKNVKSAIDLNKYNELFLLNYDNTNYRDIISVNLVTDTFLNNIRNNLDDYIMNNVMNTQNNFVIYIENTSGYDQNSFYNLKYYPFLISGDDLKTPDYTSKILNYCNYELDNNSNINKYNDFNSFGYTKIRSLMLNEEELNQVNYCLYANPNGYIHLASDGVIPFDEDMSEVIDSEGNIIRKGDKIIDIDLPNYNIRLTLTIKINKNDNSFGYISGGTGSTINPYIVKGGVR